MSNDDFCLFLDKVFDNYAKVLKKGGGCYVFHSTSTQSQFQASLEKS